MSYPKDREEQDLFRQQVLSDTGAFCRQVIGMDTDRDQKGNATSDIGKGGVRSWGPHQEVITFLDDWDPSKPFKHLMCPRFAYKSSMVQGLIARVILANPDISILTMMANKEMAAERVAVMRDILEKNEVIQEMFPGLKCTGSKYRFTTNTRKNTTLMTPTLSAGSPQNIPAGTRPNLIIFDDLADDVNTRTEAGLRKGIDTVRACLFLRAKDAIVLNVATPRHDGDVSAWIGDEPGWTKCVHLDVGYDLVQDSHGKLFWSGENGKWPHLTKEFLNSQLRGGLTYEDVMSQYKLRVVAGLHSSFKRNQFHGFNWKQEHRGLTGYLLTDVATSSSKDSCLNVLMEVGVDERQRVFVLDMAIGKWPMVEFCERFMKMRAEWSGRVNHQAELLEVTSANQGYRQHLAQMAKDQGTRLNIIAIARNASTKNKDVRILGTQVRFQSREVFINNELAGRTWIHNNEAKTIWDPEGFIDPQTGQRLPDGELVQEFIRHPFHKLKDIPDTFAMVDEMDKETGRLVCFYRKPHRQDIPDANLRRPAQKSSGPGRGYTSRFYDRYRK